MTSKTSGHAPVTRAKTETGTSTQARTRGATRTARTIQKAGTGIATFFSLALFALPVFAGQPVNINTASAEAIAESLDGVGLTKAKAIVDYRKAQGAFQHPDELVNVKGIGLSTVDRNRDFIRISEQKKVASGN